MCVLVAPMIANKWMAHAFTHAGTVWQVGVGLVGLVGLFCPGKVAFLHHFVGGQCKMHNFQPISSCTHGCGLVWPMAQHQGAMGHMGWQLGHAWGMAWPQMENYHPPKLKCLIFLAFLLW